MPDTRRTTQRETKPAGRVRAERVAPEDLHKIEASLSLPVEVWATARLDAGHLSATVMAKAQQQDGRDVVESIDVAEDEPGLDQLRAGLEWLLARYGQDAAGRVFGAVRVHEAIREEAP